MLGSSVNDIYLHYDVSDESIYTQEAKKRLKGQAGELKRKCTEYIEYMIEQHDKVVTELFRNRNENGCVLPVNIQYLISNIHGQLGLGKHSAVDVTPWEYFQMIEQTLAKLNASPYVRTNPLFEIMFKYHLSPREVLVFKRFHRAGLQILMETIVLKFKEAIVHPGEMVGVIAGNLLHN